MQILIDNQYRVKDALTEADNLARLALPMPPDFALANSVTIPLGPRPTRALFLMSRADLDTFNDEAYHTATLIEHTEHGIERARRALYNLVFVNARCLTPGKAGDEDAVYLAEFADARWLVHNHAFSVPINKQYNVRAPAWGTSGSTLYYADSTNGGTAWTWTTMIQDVWNLMSTQLGSAPTLPVTPDGTPEGWRFPGMSAWVALNQLLYRIGCAITVDLAASSSQFSIVQVGGSDATQDALEDALVLASAGARIHDEEFLESNRGGYPYGCRVFFHRAQEHYGTEQTTQQTSAQFSTAQVYSVDVNGSYTADTDSNILTPIWDDLPATYDAAGSITNAAACTTRATERAADYFRMASTGGTMMHRTFTGLRAFKPGAKLKGVCWRQDLAGIRDPEHPGGWVTEIVRHPFRFLAGRNEQGRWTEEDPGSTALRPPDLAPTYPNYPHLLQVIKLASGTPSSGRYDAYVQIYDPTALTDSNGEQVWAVDLSGATSLVADEKYLARLQGYYTAGTRPIYRFQSRAGTISGPVTFTGSPINFGPNVTVNVKQGDTWNWGDASQTATVTVNIYGAPSFKTTWNWLTDSTNNYYGTKNYKSSSSVTHEAGSTTSFALSATLNFNNRPTFNNAFVLVALTTNPGATDGLFWLDPDNNAQWYCVKDGANRGIPYVPAKPNLVIGTGAYYKFEEASGSTSFADSTTTGATVNKTGIGNDPIAGATGIVGRAIKTNASGAPISTSPTTFAVFGAATVGIACWIKVDTLPSGGSGTIAAAIVVSGFSLGIQPSTAKIGVICTTSGAPAQFISNTVATTATWYFVVAWVGSDGKANISVNGAAADQSGASMAYGPSTNTLTFQTVEDTAYTWFDETRILTSPPSTTDITQMYNAGAGRTWPYRDGLSVSQGGLGIDASVTGGTGKIVKQPFYGSPAVVSHLEQNEDTPYGRIKGYEAGY